ncbi:hypothetical protein GCM10023094_03960 [Rhodococcus olei]|uniref:Uncharacterized protein n=1 Tax=Rhodococcus olei TaxID=2161675 RepID=A0ABP8NVQ7_9NOCA
MTDPSAVELKVGRFEPEYVGKLGFYVSWVDDNLPLLTRRDHTARDGHPRFGDTGRRIALSHNAERRIPTPGTVTLLNAANWENVA